jgi:hypothetical protein
MDIRQRLIAPCARVSPQNQLEEVDISAVIRRILLFDTYIIQSARMREFPALVRAFGLHGLTELLRQKVIQVECDATAIGQSGQLAILEERAKKGLLPRSSFSFSRVQVTDWRKYVHDCLQEVQSGTSLATKEIIKLKREIVGALVDRPDDSGFDAVRQLETDLKNGSPLIKPVLVRTLKRDYDLQLNSEDLTLEIHPIDDHDFTVRSNLDVYGFDEIKKHQAMEKALLALGALNRRIEEMKIHSAISGALDDECPLLTEKLGFLAHAVSPTNYERQFQRIVEVRDLPQYDPDSTKIDVDKILRVRNTPEAVEFRHWLRSNASATDKEIDDRVSSFRARMADSVQSNPGKAVRLVTATGLGLIPGLGTLIGLGFGVLDTFLLEKVLPKSGVWTFINRMYPSIFKQE